MRLFIKILSGTVGSIVFFIGSALAGAVLSSVIGELLIAIKLLNPSSINSFNKIFMSLILFSGPILGFYVGYSRALKKSTQDIGSKQLVGKLVLLVVLLSIIGFIGYVMYANMRAYNQYGYYVRVSDEIVFDSKIDPRNPQITNHGRMLKEEIVELDEDLDNGDGVNIAARIEGLADPGGICISRSAYDQLRGKLQVGYEYLGEHSVKNISEPVRVYRVLTDPGHAGKILGEKKRLNTISRKWAFVIIAALIIVSGILATWIFHLNQSQRIEPASVNKLAFPLPEKPSVVILPFQNLSNDQSHQYLVNGATDAVRIALARVPNLFVIDHNSSSTYQDKNLSIKQVAEELGVRYVIEGSVQQSAETIRINAKLIDALAGRYIWAETFDRKQADLLALQDEIGQRIATELEVQLTEGEQARIWFRQPNNFEAYRQFRIGKEHYRKRNKRENIAARKLYEQAILLDPNFAEAKCHLGFTYIQEALNGWTKNRAAAFDRARELAREAINLDPNYPHAYALLGSVYLWQGERIKAFESISRAIELEPNYAGNVAMQALTLVYLEKPGDALDAIETAIRLNPYYPSWHLGVVGRSYLLMNRYDEAIEAFESRRKISKSLSIHNS